MSEKSLLFLRYFATLNPQDLHFIPPPLRRGLGGVDSLFENLRHYFFALLTHPLNPPPQGRGRE
ncbi:hypothetical protein [Helicobacter sp. 23-1045]